jgi:hypothetical protein
MGRGSFSSNSGVSAKIFATSVEVSGWRLTSAASAARFTSSRTSLFICNLPRVHEVFFKQPLFRQQKRIALGCAYDFLRYSIFSLVVGIGMRIDPDDLRFTRAGPTPSRRRRISSEAAA